MNIYTIGYTKKTLRDFIYKLKTNKISKIIDVRLNNTSQLAGFSKKDDLKYILELFNIGYEHNINFAPTKELLTKYKKGIIKWDEYERNYINLLKKRNIDVKMEDNICLLCSEDKADRCHRRLAAEYLKDLSDKDVNIIHL